MKNIALTGMMGSGKSAIGKELQSFLPKFEYFEMDELIVKKMGISINEIFEKYGEPYFRTLETDLIKSFALKNNSIISMGGGAFLSEENRKLFKQNSITVYLKTSDNVLYERLKGDKTRPLLKADDLKSKISDLLKQREEKYKMADYTITTDNKGIQEITQEILEIYKENGH